MVEKEFGLPVSVISATIQELRIHVPWTALTSAPIEVFTFLNYYFTFFYNFIKD